MVLGFVMAQTTPLALRRSISSTVIPNFVIVLSQARAKPLNAAWGIRQTWHQVGYGQFAHSVILNFQYVATRGVLRVLENLVNCVDWAARNLCYLANRQDL